MTAETILLNAFFGFWYILGEPFFEFSIAGLVFVIYYCLYYLLAKR